VNEESELNNKALDVPSLRVEVVLVLLSLKVVPLFAALDDAVGEEAVLVLNEVGDGLGSHISTGGLVGSNAVGEFSLLVGDVDHRFAVSEVAQLCGNEESDVLADVGDFKDGLHFFILFFHSDFF